MSTRLRRDLTLALAAPAFFLAGACATGGGKRSDFLAPLSRTETLARILVLEDSRTLGEGALVSFLRHEDPAIRRRAAQAAGRICDPLAIPQLLPRLHDDVVEVRRATAFALGLIGGAQASPSLLAALADPDPQTRGRSSEALSRIGDTTAGPAIAEAFLRSRPGPGNVPLRIRGDDPGSADDPWIELRLHLAALARLRDAASLSRVVLGPDGMPHVDWWVSVWAAVRIADPRLAPILVAGATTEDAYIRSLAARGLGALKNPAHLALVRRLMEDRDPRVAIEALRAAAFLGSAEVSALVAAQLDSPNLTVRREALLALADLPGASKWRFRVMENVGHADPWVRSAAWSALIKIDAEDIGIVLSTIGPDADWGVRQSMARTLAESLGERATRFLLPMLKDPDTRVLPSVLSALARARGQNVRSTFEDYVKHPDLGVRVAAVEGLSSIEGGEEKNSTDALSRAWDASRDDKDVEAQMAVVAAAAKGPSEAGRALLRRISGSGASRAVRQKAMAALSEGFAGEEETALRMADARRIVAVYEPESAVLYSPRVRIVTRQGAIEMALDVVEAPLTSTFFVRLAQSGFFNGLTFHRVVPGFVIQGGDPRGDGFGGPGTTIRSEPSARPFGRGAVGMASAGKDTEGSQFFIALEPQPHLDGAYTQFGQVISGMEILDRIRPGDTIERIEVFDGRDAR